MSTQDDEYSHIETEDDLRKMTIPQLRVLMAAWNIPLPRSTALKQQIINTLMKKLKERKLIAQTRERVIKDIEMEKKKDESDGDEDNEDMEDINNKTYTKQELESMTKEELVKIAENCFITTIHFPSVSKEQLVVKLFDIQKERRRIELKERDDPLSKYYKGTVEYALPISLILRIIQHVWRLETTTKLIRYTPTYSESFEFPPKYKQAVKYGMICKQIFKFVSKSLYNSIYIADGHRVEDYQRRFESPYCLAKSIEKIFIYANECKLLMDPSPTIVKTFSGITKLVLGNTRISILTIMQTLKHVSKFEFYGQLQDSDYEMVAKWWVSLESVNFLQCTTLVVDKFLSFIDHQRFKTLILPYYSIHFRANIPDTVKSSLVRFGPIPHSLPTELSLYPKLEKFQIFDFGDQSIQIPKLNNTVLDYTCNIRKFRMPITSQQGNIIDDIFHLFSLMPKLETIVDTCKHSLLEPWRVIKYSQITKVNKAKVIHHLKHMSSTIRTIVMYFEFTFAISDSRKEYYPVQYRNTLDECGFTYKGEELPLETPSPRYHAVRYHLGGCRKVYFDRVNTIE